MKKILLLPCIIFLLFGCSNDNDSNLLIENSPEEVNNESNGFFYNENFLSTPIVYVYNENTGNNSNPEDIEIILSNYNLLTENASSGVTFVYMDFQDFEIQENTYTNISDYYVRENASVDQQIVNGGNLILSSNEETLMANNISITINTITENFINLEYSFTRADGLEINGNYSGSYSQIYTSPED